MKINYSIGQQLEHIVRNNADEIVMVEISPDELVRLFVELVVTGNEYFFSLCYGKPTEYDRMVCMVKRELSMINNLNELRTLMMEDADTLSALYKRVRGYVIQPHLQWYTYKNVMLHLPDVYEYLQYTHSAKNNTPIS